MKPTYIKVHVVANHYTITFGNLFGVTHRITGPGNKAQAIELATRNAKNHGFSHMWVKVGRGEFVMTQVAA